MAILISDAAAGADAAQRIFHGRDADAIEERFSKEFAEAAVREFGRLQEGARGGILDRAAKGAEQGAEQLNVGEFHGLVEIIQNADDQGARNVRMGFRMRGRSTDLLVAHDGERVHFAEAIAMTYAFVSTKRSDPSKTGKFGVGLKTLGQLGSRLTVHSEPYHFAIEQGRISWADPAEANSHLNDESGTLLELRLKPEFKQAEFEAWLEAKGLSWLVFLRSVRKVESIDTRSGDVRMAHRLNLGPTSTVSVKLGSLRLEAQRAILKNPGRKNSWTRYVVECPAPAGGSRRYKETGPTVTLGVALPTDASPNFVYSGLPLDFPTDLPFSLNAPFDTDTARRALLHVPWNDQLLELLGNFIGAITMGRFAESPSSGWTCIPTMSEAAAGDDRWLAERLQRLVAAIHERVRQDRFIRIGRRYHGLSDLVYEGARLDGVLTSADVEPLARDKHALPGEFRDRAKRWRTVLDDLGDATRIDVDKAIELFDMEDGVIGDRSGIWFVQLLGAALDGGLSSEVWTQACLLTSTGRVTPSNCGRSVLLVEKRGGRLSEQLALAHHLDAAYFANRRDATVVRAWLKDNDLLSDAPTPEAELNVLANRRAAPLVLADPGLLALRDTLGAVSEEDASRLGLRIGGCVLLRGFVWENGRQRPVELRPTEAYMPYSLEKRKDSWGPAAGKTPGINWISPTYETVLRTKTSGRGAIKLLRLLGVRTSPRLLEHTNVEYRFSDSATPIARWHLSRLQDQELASLDSWQTTHIRWDRVSPDLEAVVQSIATERVTTARRNRAKALVATLRRHWVDDYEDHQYAQVVYSKRKWVPSRSVTATWLARAAQVPWLTNHKGQKRAPMDLAVRTQRSITVLGTDPARFAYELSESDAREPAVLALGVEGDPRASTIIDELQAIRDSSLRGEPCDLSNVIGLYVALAGHCRSPNDGDGMIDDLTGAQVRGRFGSRNTKGLVFSNGDWLPPAKVFRGRAIFGARRAFVPQQSRADALWRFLGITLPTVEDCVEVLNEIAADGAEPADPGMLTEIYRHLASQLDRPYPARIANDLARLPLWTGNVWRTTRPIYASGDRQLEAALATQIPMWRPPCALATLGRLVDAVKARPIDDGDLTPTGVGAMAASQGKLIQPRFATAVELLRDYLADTNDLAYRQHAVEWNQIANAEVAVAEDLGVELRLDRSVYTAQVQAHISTDPLRFYFADLDAVGNSDAGGRRISSLFSLEDSGKELVALAWERSWARSASTTPNGIRLVDHEPVEPAVPTAARSPVVRPGRGAKRSDRPEQSPAAQPTKTPSPSRRLKSLGSGSAAPLAEAEAINAGRARPQHRRGLRNPPPESRRTKRAPERADRAYSDQELEDAAFAELQRSLTEHRGIMLRDVRQQRGIGADGIDQYNRYFEMKSSGRDLPDKITMSANEHEQALTMRENFILAVVAGLEEGFDTIIKLIPDPLKALDWEPGTSLTLVGITSLPVKILNDLKPVH